ncbi:MAG: hypothetical protein ACLP50_29640 [Solirubrobacteraceae bacterium]
MRAYTPVCEPRGIERPIVEAPLSADPRSTWYVTPAADIVAELVSKT